MQSAKKKSAPVFCERSTVNFTFNAACPPLISPVHTCFYRDFVYSLDYSVRNEQMYGENVFFFFFVLRYRFLLIIWPLFLSFVLLHVPLNLCTSHINAETNHLVGFSCFLFSYSATRKWLDCLERKDNQCRSWLSKDKSNYGQSS